MHNEGLDLVHFKAMCQAVTRVDWEDLPMVRTLLAAESKGDVRADPCSDNTTGATADNSARIGV